MLGRPFIQRRGFTPSRLRAPGGGGIIAPPSPEDFGVLARSIDADTLVGADGSAVAEWPNVSTQTADIVAGYTQGVAGNRPILGTMNGHRYVARSGGTTAGTVSWMETEDTQADLRNLHVFAVVQVMGTGTSTIASNAGGTMKFEATGSAGLVGPGLIGGVSPWANALDQRNTNRITVGEWVVVEAELYSLASSGTSLRVNGVTVDTTANQQLAEIQMPILFSAYTGPRADLRVALANYYDVAGGALADPAGARALVQSRADALNGV